MADMQAGMGPFPGVFLQQRGWAPSPIGVVISLGGGLALGSVLLWLGFAPMLRRACANPSAAKGPGPA